MIYSNADNCYRDVKGADRMWWVWRQTKMLGRAYNDVAGQLAISREYVRYMIARVEIKMDVDRRRLAHAGCSRTLDVDLVEVPSRVQRALKWEGIRTLADVELYTDVELLRMPGFGEKSLRELRAACERYGVVIGRRAGERL